jgi:oligopeptide transport system permease protein
MGRVLVVRFLQTLFSLWLLATITFFLMKVFPGSPFDDEIQLHPTVLEKVEKAYGLQENTIVQYFIFLKNLSLGQFGSSQVFLEKDAKEVILEHFPVTLSLAVLSFITSFLIGTFIALSSFYSRLTEKFYDSLTLILVSIPIVLAGPALIYFFGIYLQWLPVALLEEGKSYILPVLIISLRPISSIARILKNSLQESLSADYSRTLRSFGFSQNYILFKSAFKNSLIPLLAYLGPLCAGLLAGSTVVEILFAIPGLGTQFVEAALNRDASMVLGLTVFYGFFIYIFQWLVDLLILVVDPRTQVVGDRL